jgi:hypothetical protein
MEGNFERKISGKNGSEDWYYEESLYSWIIYVIVRGVEFSEVN